MSRGSEMAPPKTPGNTRPASQLYNEGLHEVRWWHTFDTLLGALVRKSTDDVAGAFRWPLIHRATDMAELVHVFKPDDAPLPTDEI